MRRITVILLAETDRIERLTDRELCRRSCRKARPFICAPFDVGRNIAAAVHDEHEVHAALRFEVVHRLGVAFKMVFLASVFEHQQIAPLRETEFAP